jgi:hypothetical protein
MSRTSKLKKQNKVKLHPQQKPKPPKREIAPNAAAQDLCMILKQQKLYVWTAACGSAKIADRGPEWRAF